MEQWLRERGHHDDVCILRNADVWVGIVREFVYFSGR